MIKPLGKRVVLKEIKKEEKTKSGLILAGEKEETQKATVIEIGAKVKNINKDDKVYYKKYSGTKVEFDNEEYIIIDSEDILAIIE